MKHWRLDRRQRWLRVEVDPGALAHHDEDAIVRAVQVEADHTDLDDIHVTGRLLMRPVPGTRTLLRRVGDIARAHGMRFHVGPI